MHHRAEEHLYDFLQQAWPTIEPETTLRMNWHIELICEHLEAVSRGEVTRLIINEPPRSLKSIVLSVCWPAWSWLHHPASRWMFTSYSQSLSSFHSLNRRQLIMSDWYQEAWGDRFALCGDHNLKTEFANDKTGMMIATSVGGSSVGKGGDILVMDDPMNPQEALSTAERETANTWIRQSFLTRLNDPKTGAIVLVMQRLHEQDTTGMLLEMGGWEHLCLPAIAEEPQRLVFPLTGRVWPREAGEILCPEREGAAELARKKVELGSYGFAGQYQQRPAPAEGGMLKRPWWRFWYPTSLCELRGTGGTTDGADDADFRASRGGTNSGLLGVDEAGRADSGRPLGGRGLPAPAPVVVRLEDGSVFECPQVAVPGRFDEEVLSWDMAFKDLASSDYVVGQAWGRVGADKFLLDQAREQADFPRTLKLVLRMVARYPRAAVLVEDKANGSAVLQVLRRDVAGMIAVNPEGGKEARAHAVAPMIESGNVYLPHPSIAPWVGDFIERASAFPHAAHDDEIDAMTQALLRLKLHDLLPWTPAEEKLSADEKWNALMQRMGIEGERGAKATGW